MFCAKCGRELEEGRMVCPSCGYDNNRGNINGNSNIPSKTYIQEMDYTPIGMWGYFGWSILFGLPMIGWIFAIVFSVGGTKNINLRNFARAQFCKSILLAAVVILFLLAIAGAAGAASAYSY